LLSPARKRSRQDTDASVVSESTAIATTVGAGDADVAAAEKLPATVSSPVEKSVDSTNVELSLSAVCEPYTASSASAAFVFGRSGSCNSLSRHASAVRSGNSSPRTWPSRRDLGRVTFSHMRSRLHCEYVLCIIRVLKSDSWQKRSNPSSFWMTVVYGDRICLTQSDSSCIDRCFGFPLLVW